MTEQPTDPTPADGTRLVPGALHRNASIIVVVVLGFVLVGFLRGIREPQTIVPSSAVPQATAGAPLAVRYSELPTAKLKPTTGWENHLAHLKSERPGLRAVVVRTEQLKLEALVDRAANRAFDGAPPTIPHPVLQTTTANCLLCHGEGVKVLDRIATKMSHPKYDNCTQCHVEMSRPEFDSFSSPMADNDFAGRQRAGPGIRLYPGAPPTVPHTTWMRQDCSSCHGLVARPGIRTTHPWLTNCLQCHAVSAELEQVLFPSRGKR